MKTRLLGQQHFNQSEEESYLQGIDCFSTISPDKILISACEVEISVDKCNEEPLIFLNASKKKKNHTQNTIHLEATYYHRRAACINKIIFKVMMEL